MAINLTMVFHMKEGVDETSYAKASYIQKHFLSLTKPIREKAMRELNFEELPTTLCIADLGCSSAELNSLSLICELIETIDKASREQGHGPKEYQIYLNDLPGNDFNTVFRSVVRFKDNLKQQMGDDFGHCFVNGVPGSFYGRLFPANSLHFVHSSSSLHWLSQVPVGIEDNKRNIYVAETSPPRVLKAYYDQFQKDFMLFLHCRSKEVVAGGKMVLTLVGRKNNEPCYSKESNYMWDLLATVLHDMVSEGYIEEEKLNTFNIPMYSPSPLELEFLVNKEGSFALNQAHVFHVSWEANDHDNGSSVSTSECRNQYDFTTCMRAVVETLISSHFGEAIINEIFKRYKRIVDVSMAKEKNVVANLAISLTRRDRG